MEFLCTGNWDAVVSALALFIHDHEERSIVLAVALKRTYFRHLSLGVLRVPVVASDFQALSYMVALLNSGWCLEIERIHVT